LPKLDSSETQVDVSLLDVMGIEDFLSLLKTRTENNSRELLKETSTMAHQLKASRELLSICSSLFSNEVSTKMIDRLLDAAYTILNAERIYIFVLDPTGTELVVKRSRDKKAEGLRIPAHTGIEGDVVSKKICANVPDVTQDPRFIPALDTKLGARTRCMACAPIIIKGEVVGVVQASNKISVVSPRNGRDFSLLSFSSNEALLLGFIAMNVGLALQRDSHSDTTDLAAVDMRMPSVPLDTYRSDHRRKARSVDVKLKAMVEAACKLLDADRVSVFAYIPAVQSLLCIASKDIEGSSVPVDKGFAGLTFKNREVMNVTEITEDVRHFADVDTNSGFSTRTLLSAPILGPDGRVLGVVQAINKIGGVFSAKDEQQLKDICDRTADLMKDEFRGQREAAETTAREGDALARCVSNIMLCRRLPELAGEVEAAVRTLTDCDYASLLVLDHNGTLLPLTPLDQPSVSYAEIPLSIKQALQFASVVEFSLPEPTDSGDSHYLLPGLPLQEALILPLQAKAYPYVHGSCVLIAGRVGDTPLPKDTLATLETLCDFVNGGLQALSQKLEHDDRVKLMKVQFNLVNNSLAALRDLIILLDEEGNFIGSNRVVEELLGFPEAHPQAHPEGNSNGSQRPRPPHCAIVDGAHYTEWMTNGNSPELCRDIALALQQKKVRSLDKVKFFSVVHPDGILIDYQVVPIENLQVGEEEIPTPRIMLAQPQSESSMPNDDEEIVGLTNCAVVVVIHTENFHHRKTLGPAVSTGKVMLSFANMEMDSAHGVVDAATSIVNNVRSSFRLENDVEEALKHITKSLNNASRKLSINSSAGSTLVDSAIANATLSLVSNEEIIPKDIFEWEFNVLNFTDGRALCNIIGKFFEALFNLDDLQIDTSTLARYIIEVGKNYHDRPFHNLQHSSCVTHFTYKLITTTEAMEMLSKHQQFAILISAVVHDVDHPGNTNLFEVNSASELALRYNDQAVLENHHCSTAFRLMRKPNLNILSSLPKSVATEVRKTIISCVMATDMAVHFDLIDETKKKAHEGGINFEDPKDQAFLGKILLHSADLSNPVRPFHVTREWARRISLEFNDQVIREQALGMPVLGFMMTPDEKAFCKNETGFASFVVAPMWRAMSMLYPQLNFLVEQLESNVVVWKQSLEKLQEEEEAKFDK